MQHESFMSRILEPAVLKGWWNFDTGPLGEVWYLVGVSYLWAAVRAVYTYPLLGDGYRGQNELESCL
jgi:hypothetical protein